MIDDLIIGNPGKEVTFKAVGAGTFWYNFIDGIATPTYRNVNVTSIGRNGGYTPIQLYGQRVVSINGGMRECPDFMQARQQLIEALSFNEDVPLKILRKDGRVFQLMGKFDYPQMPIEEFFMNEFQLIFLSTDTFFSDVTSGEENKITVSPNVSGGWKIYPEGWKIYPEGWKIYPGGDGQNAHNSGTTDANVIIEIHGPAQNPTVINNTTGEQIKVNITIGSNDVILIDTALKSTTLNGGNINALVEAGSTYFTLQKGDNAISYRSDTSGYADVKWYTQYTGI